MGAIWLSVRLFDKERCKISEALFLMNDSLISRNNIERCIVDSLDPTPYMHHFFIFSPKENNDLYIISMQITERVGIEQ